jgi:hypothetical protein
VTRAIEVAPVEGEVVEYLTVEQAEILTDQIIDAFDGITEQANNVRQLVRTAIEHQVWITLDFPTFEEWATDCFASTQVNAESMIHALADEFSVRTIAAVVGQPKSTVARKVSQVSQSGTPAPKVTGKDGKSYPAKATGIRAVTAAEKKAAQESREKRAAAKARHDTKVAEARILANRDPELSELHRDHLLWWMEGSKSFDRTDDSIRLITLIGRYALTVVTHLVPPEKGQANRSQPKESDEWPRAKRCEAELHDLDLSIDRLVDFQRRVHEAIEAAIGTRNGP